MTTALQQTLPSADFKNVGFGRQVPAADRCLLWHELGVDERSSTLNHVFGGERGRLGGIVGGGVPAVGATGLAAGTTLTTGIGSDAFGAGDSTIIAFVTVGAGSVPDFGQAVYVGSYYGANNSQFQISPLRYGAYVDARIFSGAMNAWIGLTGVMNPAALAADGDQTVASFSTTSAQPVMVMVEYVAATRITTVTLRNAGVFSTPSVTSSAAATSGFVREQRTSCPFGIGCNPQSTSIAHFLAAFTGILTTAEKNAVYASESARLTALGVANL